jgi:CDP-diacylglycerol--glycerol-3-phosphate 3-phosphatidyltransferase
MSTAIVVRPDTFAKAVAPVTFTALFMDLRRFTLLPEPLKVAFLEWIDPLADALIKAGLTPNRITTLSILTLLGSGTAFALGELRIGAALLLLSGLFDLLDGKVARRSHQESKFGAFYDSVMDRLGEAALFTGISIYFLTAAGQRWPILGLIVCFASLSGAFLVSYARARAEGLGLDCKVGMAQRAERILFIAVPTLIWGAGRHGYLLLAILVVLMLMSFLTVWQRIIHVWRITEGSAASPPARGQRNSPAVVVADSALKGR